MGKTQKMTIGKAAKRANVNIQTLRYYERRNLLRPATREESGYRVYDEDSVSRLRFIKFAQELGFSLRDIKELLSLRTDKSGCEKTKVRTSRKLIEIEEKISRLERMRETLRSLMNECDSSKTGGSCPILFHFEKEMSE